MKDTIEFYNGKKLVASVHSSMVPPIGSKISIDKSVWEVVNVTYAIDDYAYNLYTNMRACVDLVFVRKNRKDEMY